MSARISPPPDAAVAADVAAALAEDIGPGDATASLLDDAPDSAYLLCKEDCVLAGRPWFDACHRALDPEVRIDWRHQEGDRIAKGTVVATLQGRNRALVSAERASLNFLQTLSGTATVTARYVDAVRGTGAAILDTRKTLPGLRVAQKYAVRAGGGMNHRMALFDAVMLKENHIRAFGSVAAAIARARDLHPELPLIVEIQSERFHTSLVARADDVRRIERLRRAGFVVLEISDADVWTRPEAAVAPIAEAPASLNWRVSAAAFQALRAHPAVAGTQVEVRRPEMKEVKRWGSKRG